MAERTVALRKNGLGRNSAPTCVEESGAGSKNDGVGNGRDGRVKFRWCAEVGAGNTGPLGTDGKESKNGDGIDDVLESSDIHEDGRVMSFGLGKSDSAIGDRVMVSSETVAGDGRSDV